MSRMLLRISVLLLAVDLAACQHDEEGRHQAGGTSRDVAGSENAVLIHNARIYTFDADDTVVDPGSLAVSPAGNILAIGDAEGMLSAFPRSKPVDLKGGLLLPGLIDSHGHLHGLALSYTRANLVGAGSKAEVIQRLKDFESGLSDDDWLLGRGWDQNDWPEQTFPDRQDLDAVFPDRRVWLERIDGHAAWGNSAALAQVDRDLAGSWQPEGGVIHRDQSGQPTGIFIDGAKSLVEPLIPLPSRESVGAALDLAAQTLISVGITAVHDPGVGLGIFDLYREKIRRGNFPLRVYAMADGIGATLDWLCAHGPVNDPSGRLVMRSVKLYADGALGSRGAALLDDYSDEPGNRGLLFVSQQRLEQQVRRVLSCGLQLGIHAIGDAANRQALDAFEHVLPEFPENPGRHRIEHAQILHPDDIPRFAKLGIIAAMQPVHATSDMYWAEQRLGAQRSRGAYAWRSLLDSGAVLAFGSDFPIEEVNPMVGVHAAVTRQDLAGWPAGGWHPEQGLSRKQAIRAFTLDAARAGFMEDAIGSLEPGKRADFIVLDRDILQVPVDEIAAARVLQTWFDGNLVYERK